jgi:hypothetical protein
MGPPPESGTMQLKTKSNFESAIGYLLSATLRVRLCRAGFII